MKKEELEQYLNYKIKINLKDNTFFSGYIKNLHEDCFTVLDKFGNLVTIEYSDLSFIIQLSGEP